jgi:hypothetical protein
LFMSVGMVTVAGKLVQRPVGSARLVPVRVSSSLVPRGMPTGVTGLSVGASGLGAIGGGCCAAATAARQTNEQAMKRQWCKRMVILKRRSQRGGDVGGRGW